MPDPVDVEISLRRTLQAGCYEVSLRASIPERSSEEHARSTISIDAPALLGLLLDAPAYGLALGKALFADPGVYAALVTARQAAESADEGPAELRVRLFIDEDAPELHSLHWEMLADPDSGEALCAGERLLFSRYLAGKAFSPRPRPKTALRALAAASGPANLIDYSMAEVDVEGEIERARANLEGILLDSLPAFDANGGGPTGRCSLDAIAGLLRGGAERAADFPGYDVLYIACHGRMKDDQPWLALEDEQGQTVWIAGTELALRLGELARPPRLVVLAACEGAGSDANDVLSALGPRLVAQGIPAVLAMQGKVFMRTVAAFMPVFFRELARDGLIDRAAAVARGAIRRRPDWWAPVLFMRLRDGRLWRAAEESPAANELPTPHQIPPPSEDFVGREAELEMLRVAIELQGEPVVGISGMGGMGKTAIALKLADRLLPRYPGGQIYYDFGESSLRPTGPVEALSHVLRSFLPQVQLPQNLPELRALYLSVLFNRGVMILLDNARTEDQVAALMPPPRGCLVMVTAWRRLDLPGIYDLTLGELADDDAQEMLLDLAPQISDPDLALRLAQACGKMPQAIQVVASLLRRRPDLDPVDLARRMSDEASRLALSGMESLLEVSYSMLVARLQRPWKQLAVFAGGFDALAAAWVWGMVTPDTPGMYVDPAVDNARDLLGELLEHSLLHFDKSTRHYQMYNLARIYAAKIMQPDERLDSLRRHAACFLRVLAKANDLFTRGGESALEGLALFDHERREISAAQAWAAAGPDSDPERLRLCSDFAAYGWYCVALRLPPKEQVAWLEAGLRAARLLNLRRSQGIHLGNLGNATMTLHGPRLATPYFRDQLKLAKEVGDEQLQIDAYSNMGIAYWMQGKHKQAVTQYKRGLSLARRLGDRAGEARALGNLGLTYHSLKDTASAVQHYEQQLAIAREIGDLQQVSNALNNLGIERAALGESDKANEAFIEALALFKQLDDRAGYGRTLDSQGTALHKQGNLEAARQALNEAIRWQREAYDRAGEAISQWNLAEVLVDMGELARAVELMRMTIAYEKEVAAPDRAVHEERLAEVLRSAPVNGTTDELGWGR